MADQNEEKSLVEITTEKLDRSKMLDIIGMDLSGHKVTQMSLGAQRRLRASILNLRTGVQSVIPAICPGAVRCPFRHKCPIVDPDIKDVNGEIDFIHQKASDFPIGEACVQEQAVLNAYRRDYMVEYEIDPESPTEIGMSNKLAELDLLEMRVSILLAAGDDKQEGQNLLKKQVAAVGQDGKVYHRLEIHPLWELKEKIQKQRDNILQAMVGTRREQYKRDAALKTSGGSDPGSIAAGLKAQLEKARIKEEEDIIEAEFTETEEE